jgi:hypothetical protein
MPVTLRINANERSAIFVDVSFFDEDNAPTAPNVGTCTWTLTDELGRVVNNRNGVPFTPAETVTIALMGADLAVGGATGLVGTVRKILIECQYDSTNGANIPMSDEITFDINDFVAIVG